MVGRLIQSLPDRRRPIERRRHRARGLRARLSQRRIPWPDEADGEPAAREGRFAAHPVAPLVREPNETFGADDVRAVRARRHLGEVLADEAVPRQAVEGGVELLRAERAATLEDDRRDAELFRLRSMLACVSLCVLSGRRAPTSLVEGTSKSERRDTRRCAPPSATRGAGPRHSYQTTPCPGSPSGRRGPSSLRRVSRWG